MSCRERHRGYQQPRSPSNSLPTPVSSSGSESCRNTPRGPCLCDNRARGGWGQPRRGHLQSAVPPWQLLWPWPGLHRWLCVPTLTFRVLSVRAHTQQCGIEPLLASPPPHSSLLVQCGHMTPLSLVLASVTSFLSAWGVVGFCCMLNCVGDAEDLWKIMRQSREA